MFPAGNNSGRWVSNMAQQEKGKLSEAIDELWLLHAKLQCLMEDIEEHYDQWVNDGDSKHSDVCFRRFVRSLGELYAVQDLICATDSEFIEDCGLRQSMDELRVQLERCLRGGIDARERYERSVLIAKYAVSREDEDQPCDYSIESLRIDDEKLADLSVSILCLENNWLREQQGWGVAPASKFMSVSELGKWKGIENQEALRKRLERWRKRHAFDPEAFREVQNRGTREPAFLYNRQRVEPILDGLLAKEMSAKRPSKRTD